MSQQCLYQSGGNAQTLPGEVYLYEWYSDLDAINLVLWCYQSLKLVCGRFVYTTAGIKLHTFPPPSTIHITVLLSGEGKLKLV